MSERKIRILLGKIGEGGKESQLNLAKSFGDAGFEVIYTELEDPEAIVRSAVQESVDHIGITTLPGADTKVLEELKGVLVREKVGHITITAGGYLDERNIQRVMEIGIMAFFPKGTTIVELIEWSRKNIKPRAE